MLLESGFAILRCFLNSELFFLRHVKVNSRLTGVIVMSIKTQLFAAVAVVTLAVAGPRSGWGPGGDGGHDGGGGGGHEGGGHGGHEGGGHEGGGHGGHEGGGHEGGGHGHEGGH